MRNSRSYLSLLIVTFVTAMFMLTFSGCSKNDDVANPDITEPINDITEPDPNSGSAEEQEVTPATSITQTPICGDNNLDAEEECDGSVPADVTCESKGYDTGAVSCTRDCTLDFSECITDRIGACVDTDDGLDYAVKGTVTMTNDDGSTKKYTDYCRQADGPFDGYVYEYYCANDTVASDNHKCPSRCNNGACY